MAPGRTETASRWRDLGRRSLTAILLAPVVLVCLWQGGLAWNVLIGLATLGLGYEWSQLCRARRIPVFFLFAALAAIWGLALNGSWLVALGAIPVGAVLVWLVEMQGQGSMPHASGNKPRGRRPEEPHHSKDAPHAALLPAALFYIGPSVLALIWLRTGPSGLADMLLVLLVVWASDIAAYVVGRWIGGAKLAPTISPGKTRSGAVGGLLGAAIVAIGMAMSSGGAIASLLLVCLILSVVSQAGDLMESAIKRHFGVKDSGWLVPGHGGLFDRLDGVLVVAPAAAALALVLGRGVMGFG